MRTVIRNSYTPKLGDYCNTLVVDKETGNQYLFDKDGVWTLISTDEEGIVAEAVAQANAYTDDVAEGKVDKEEGKGLSENDFTDEDKDKLDSIEADAQENVIEVVKRNGVALPVTDKTVDVEVPTATSALTNDSGYITNEVDNLVNYYDKDETDELIAEEALTRDAADQDLQEQIDAISSASDVVDVVGTYAELQNYDTSSLSDNDIIKVLSDSTHDDATTYYRWTNNQFSYIGSEGPFYTKGEADATFVPLTRTINGKGLNSDVVLTAADVNALPASTVIPTVNDATLTIQKNGSTVTTFTANSSQNATANITVPTKTSDLTNDGEAGTSTYVEANDLAAVATSGSYNDLSDTPTIPSAMPLYTALGENTDGPITQKASREAIYADTNRRRIKLGSKSSSDTFGQDSVSIGSAARGSDLATVAVGNSSVANGTYSIAIGKESITGNNYGAVTIGANSGIVAGGTAKIGAVALGAWAKAGRPYEVNVGTGTQDGFDGAGDHTRVIAGVHAGILDTDAVNVSQLNSAIPTNVSELTNDAGYITNASLPTKTSDLTNDSGFITNQVSNLANYYDQTTINNMFNALPAVPTKTSDLTNDSGFLTTSTLPIATTSSLGVVKIGSGLSIAADGTLSSSALQSVDWADITGKPTNVSYWTNDAGYITSAALPTKTSDLTNDSGFITSASLPTKTSDLTNDSGFITSSVNNLTNYYTKSQTYTQGEVNSLLSAITIPTKTSDLTNDGADGTSTYVEADDLATVATSGSYNDLSDKPTIGNATLTIQRNGTNVQTFTANATSNKTANITVPTKTSDITNDSGFLTSTNYATSTTGGVVKVGSGLEITNGVLSATGGGTADAVEWDNVLNKPTFATVATSGNYNDLSNKPTIPTVNDATLTITQNGTSVGTFTANASSNKTIALTDTTYSNATTSTAGLMSAADKTKLNGIATGAEVNVQSDWSVTDSSSDAFIKNKPTIPTVNNGTLTIQKNGTNVQTFTANQSGNATANITVPTKTSELTNDSDFATKAYIQSRDENLVTNGSGLLGNNYNFSMLTFDPANAYGTPGSFKTTARQAVLYNDEYIPVDITSSYKMSFDVKTTNGSARFYNAIQSYDVDKQSILFRHVNWIANTTTTLSQALNTGDTVIHLTSAANWNTTTTYSYQKGIIVWNYENSYGYEYPVETYSRNVYPSLYTDNGAVNKTSNTITLTSGWTGPNLPAGTSISQCTDGSTYIYIGDSNYTVPANTWTHKEGILSPSMYRAGTAYVRIGWLANRDITGDISTWFNNVKFSEYVAGLTVDSALSSSSTNPVQNKVINTALGTKANSADLATVATSGSYNDLSNKPTIPTVNNATLTIQKNGTTVKTFTANASSNVTANITVPTTVAELSDAGNYATNTALDDKQDILTAGSHISISGDTISATGYVHSENPVTAASSTATVTGSMIANGSITADKLASGATIKLTLSTTDIGEGAALAANTLYGVYQ